MKLDELLGFDGFILRFFMDFWGDIGKFVVCLINYVYDVDFSMFSIIQRYGIIICLLKEDILKYFLENWRLIF